MNGALAGCEVNGRGRCLNVNVNLSVKANLAVKMSFVESSHLIEPKIRNILVRGLYGSGNSMFHSGPSFTGD